MTRAAEEVKDLEMAAATQPQGKVGDRVKQAEKIIKCVPEVKPNQGFCKETEKQFAKLRHSLMFWPFLSILVNLGLTFTEVQTCLYKSNMLYTIRI